MMNQHHHQVIQQIVSKTNHYLELVTVEEEELISLSQLIPGYACWKDNKGHYQGCNQKFAELLGFASSQQIVGLCDEQLSWKAHPKLIKRVDAEVLATGVARALEEGMTLPDQSTIDFFTKHIPIYNKTKEISGVLIVLFDITAQKAILKDHHHDQNQTIHELQEQVKKLKSESFLLRQVIDNLPGSVYWKDKNGVYLGNNGYAKADMQMIGQENMDPTDKTDFELFGDEIANKFKKNDLEVLSSGKEMVSEEPFVLPDGKILTRLSSKKPLYDNTGAITGIVGNTIDITHLKEVEEDLRVAKQEAEAANVAKTEFIRNISHDMRTPLAGTIGGMQLIETKAEDQAIKNLAHKIKTSVEGLLSLMNEIIDISKLELGHKVEVQNKFSLQQVFEQLGNTFMPTFQDRGLNFQINYAPELPDFIIGNNMLVHSVLLNLLGNAVKFTEKGNITLSAKLAKSADKDLAIEINVADTGMGIPANKLTQIFEAFKRLTPAYNNRYKGSGLGLFYVKKYVHQLEGEIYVTSEEGKGSTFTCILPFKRPLVENSAQGAVTIKEKYEEDVIELTKLNKPMKPLVNESDILNKQTEEKLHALLVEDTDLARITAAGLLAAQGYEVTTAETAKEAIEKANQQAFDLIYMDIGLPDGTGLKVTKAIRENQAGPNAKTAIVALTAHADDEITKDCLEAGMQHVFDKPLNLNKMEIAESIMNKLLFGKNVDSSSLTSTEKTIELPVIDLAAAIETASGNEEIAKEMIAMFMKDLPAAYQSIEEAFNQQDWDLLKQRVHKLHGALCYCGMPRFKEAARTLEHLIKDKVGNYDAAYQKFVQEMNLVIKQHQE